MPTYGIPRLFFVRAGSVPMLRSFCSQLVAKSSDITKETGYAMASGPDTRATPSSSSHSNGAGSVG